MLRKLIVRETVSLYQAKMHSRLVDRAAAGEEIVIAKSGRPQGQGSRWRLGRDFDSPLPREVLKEFEGR